jgi:hypothetical protein
MGYVSNKRLRENQATHFMSNNFFSYNRAVYEIMSKNVMEPEADDGNMAARCMLE